MPIRRKLPLVILALSFAATAVSAAPISAVVARFFPTELRQNDDGSPIRSIELQHVFLSADLDRSGQQVIVALYTNDDAGAVEVLSPDGEGSLLASDEEGLPGGNPSLELIDTDSDGRPEIVATIAQRRGGDLAWIYKWSGNKLARLHRADSHDPLDDAIVDATFLDLDGDGNPEVVEHTASRETDEQGDEHYVANYQVLSLSGGTYHNAGQADRLLLFSRGKRAPQPVNKVFTAADAAAPRRLVLVNGAVTGAPRVSSAVVKLNGQTVFSEKDFNKTVARLEAPVTLAAGDNQLSVVLRGAPGSEIAIVILPK